jgi:hypothetical protein
MPTARKLLTKTFNKTPILKPYDKEEMDGIGELRM